MMDRQSFIASLPELKKSLHPETEGWNEALAKAQAANPWFIPAFMKEALEAIRTSFLDAILCDTWLASYPQGNSSGKNIGLVMAGNIPLVGFHDLFSVLASGHTAMVKLSDKDAYLLPYVTQLWSSILPALASRIRYVDKLEHMDAVIATGSNNSLRYFEYYFNKYPHLFRQNRNGVAILHGNESPEALRLLASDLFLYFGLGCRNVSKIYVPEGYDFSAWHEAIEPWAFVGNHNKYKNNLDYNFAIYLINNVPHIHLEHLILKQDDAIASRIGCLHYSFYTDQEQVVLDLQKRKEEIQCVVSGSPIEGWEHIRFGESQRPALDQYADGVDTMTFLTQL